ncbi:hypothetical protein MMEU_2052 [Mycobacterium marinum str. Europe]|nr:hypothetical protein MMEU_2052 [Mycobacterium marinum str. Europe]
MGMMSPVAPADRLGRDDDDHFSTSRCRCGGGRVSLEQVVAPALLDRITVSALGVEM